jgi:uncharacterized protein
VFRRIFDKHFYARIAPWTVLAAVLSVPLLIYGVRGALQGGNNDVRQWLPGGFRETQEYDEFLAHFGSEEMAVVSWAGCTLDDDRLDRLAAGLAPFVDSPSSTESHSTENTGRPTPLFKRVLTTRQAIEDMTAEPGNVPPAEAVRRLSGLLIGPDGKTAAMVVMVNQAGAADRKTALELVYAEAERAGVPRDELHLAGPTVDSVALDSESQRSRYLLAAISFAVALALAWRCLRQARLIAMVFATALLCSAANVALLYFLGGTMTLLMGMMPTLIYLIGLSGSVHLVNYYRDAVRDGRLDDAPLLALKAAWLPCLLSAATTAVGLGSLATSEVLPVRSFGLYSAIGVLLTLPILYLFLPSLLHLFPVKACGAPTESHTATATGQGWADKLVTWLTAWHPWVVGVAVAVMIWTGLGVARLDTSVKLLNLFSPESRIIQDYTWMERHLGPMVPVEVVLHFDQESRLTMLERMEIVSHVEEKLNGIDKVGGTMSAVTFAPSLPVAGGAGQTTKRVMLSRRLERHRDHFAAMRYLAPVNDGELWRISARVEALNSLDYGHFVNDLKAQVQPVLNEVEAGGKGRVEATYTGLVPLVYKAQRTLLGDLSSSFVSAFALIGIMMMGLLRSVRAGLISMIPNVLPAIVMFGLMGLSATLCDIGSMMTAGTAMGIAVDDTVHFLSWFRRGTTQGMSRLEAIRWAYGQCASAMIQSTVICGLGLLAFAFSSFVPTARFAWLMAAMLGVGLVADMILLPALLAGPLGKYFMPKNAESPAPVPARDVRDSEFEMPRPALEPAAG